MDSDFMILDNVVGELLGSCRHFVTSSLISVVLISISIGCCGGKGGSKQYSRRKGGGRPKKSTTSRSTGLDSRRKNSDMLDRDDQMEDTFDFHQPKMEEAKRAKDIKDAKAFNAGDYKTWNKLMNDDNDFEKPLGNKEGG